MDSIPSYVKWENGIIGIPAQEPIAPYLDKAGEEGWEPWAIIGMTPELINIAVKRHRRKVLLSTDVQGALNS